MLRRVGNVTLPTPVFLAGGALCLLAGYLAGSVLSPGTPDPTTATVLSFDSAHSRLCLEGGAVTDQEGARNGHLCGTLRRPPGAATPAKGDTFRFVSVVTSGTVHGRDEQQVVLYGSVVG